MLNAQAKGRTETLAQLLVEAQVASVDYLRRLIVACFFLKHLHSVSLVKLQCSKIILVHELRAERILRARHKSVSHLAHEAVFPIAYILVGSIRIVEIRGVALLFLLSELISELQRIAKDSVGKREGKVDALLEFVFLDALVGVA